MVMAGAFYYGMHKFEIANDQCLRGISRIEHQLQDAEIYYEE